MHPDRLLAVVAVVVFTCVLPLAAQPPFDLVVSGGSLVDGTGQPARTVDVGIRSGRIAEIGDLTDQARTRTIDATGLVVAPGFIDLHTHADGSAAQHPEAKNFLRMGVTTIITGNCGSSVTDLANHFAKVKKLGISLNYGSLIGHGTVRRKAMGTADRAPTKAELVRMQGFVDQAMRAGAQGMSTGLIYVPGTYAKTDELIALSRVVARHGGIYASHMRDEGRRVLNSIDEALRIGRESKVRLHLSHLKASGKNNWGRGQDIVKRIADARAQGVKVTGDQYAYTASSTSIDVLFPSKELAVTRGKFALKLKNDSAFRARMHQELLKKMDRVGFGDLHYCQIAYAPSHAKLSGKSLKEAAKILLGKDDREAQATVTIDLFIASKGRRISMVYHKMTEPDVETIMRAPFVAVACDAGIRVRGAAKPHPRGAGNNSRVLARYVREREVISMSLAVRKMSGLPAEAFGLEDRGVVKTGAWADLVLFDPKTVQDRATYDAPYEAPAGMPWVIVNGIVVVENGKHNGKRPGQVLRRRSTLVGGR